MDAWKCKTEKILKLDLDIFTHAPRQNSPPGSYHHPPSKPFHVHFTWKTIMLHLLVNVAVKFLGWCSLPKLKGINK